MVDTRKKMIWALISLLMLFGIIALVAFMNLQNGRGILGMMPYAYENFIVILFCVFSSIKVVWEIHGL